MVDLTGGTGTYLPVGMTPGLPDQDPPHRRVRGRHDGSGGDAAPGSQSGDRLDQGRQHRRRGHRQAEPDLTGIYVSHAAAAQGASAAILEAGKQGQIGTSSRSTPTRSRSAT